MSRCITYNYELEPYVIKKLPATCVIYGDEKIVYVGQLANVQKGLLIHDIHYVYSNIILTPWGMFGNIKIKIKYSYKIRRLGNY
jgi:hypothetical protein